MKQTITQRLGNLKDVQDDVNPSVGNPIRFLNDLSLMDIGKVIKQSCSVEEVVTSPGKCTAHFMERVKFLHVGRKSVINIVCKDKDGRSIGSGSERDRIEPSFQGVQVNDAEVIASENGSHKVAFVVNQVGTLQFGVTINGTFASGCSLEIDAKWTISNTHGCGLLTSGGFAMTGEGDIGKYCYRLGNWSMVSGIHNWKIDVQHDVQSSDECRDGGACTFEVGVIEDSEDYSEESVKNGKTKKWVYSECSNKIRYVYLKLEKRNLTTRGSGKIVMATRNFSIRGKTLKVTSEKAFAFFSVNCPHCTLTFYKIN